MPHAAQAHCELLTALGARVRPELGPLFNPWGSMLMQKVPSRLMGFFGSNGWLAGGFR